MQLKWNYDCLGDILRQDQPCPGRGASLLTMEQMSKSLLVGFRGQEYSARSRRHPPRNHSTGWPPTMSRKPFLLEVEVGRLGP